MYFQSSSQSQTLSYYNPVNSSELLVASPVNVVSIEIRKDTHILNIPAKFYGINIHPGSAKYELPSPALLKSLKPDAVRVMTRMRSDWPERGSGRIVSAVSPAPGLFNWEELDLLLHAVVSSGADPYLALGFGPPEWISGGTSPIDRKPPMPERVSDFADLMATITHRYVVEKGFPIKRVTIDNEPENVGYAIDDYIYLVNLARAKIKERVAGVEVGGPAIGYAMWKQPTSKPLHFSESVKRFQKAATPFDFFDWHIYSTSPDTVMKTVKAVRGVYGNTMPLVISELNRDWRYAGENRSASMQNNTGWESVAWLASTYDQLQVAGVDQVFYFAWREQTLGLVDGRTTTLRPNYFLFSALTNLMDRQRVVASSSHPAVGVIATNEKGLLSALVYNMSDGDAAVKVSGAALKPVFTFSQSVYESNKGVDSDLIAKVPPRAAAGGASEATFVVPAGGFVVLKN